MDYLTTIYQAPLLPNFQQIHTPYPQPQRDRKQGRGPDKFPRFKRVAAAAAPLRDRDLTKRDIAIIEAVQSCRVLSSEQIHRWFFAGIGPDQPRSRLRKLFHSGYLYRDEMPVQRRTDKRNSFIYFLDEKGATFLAERWQVPVTAVEWSTKDRNLSINTYKHVFLIHDIRIMLTLSAQAAGIHVPIWKDERTLKREHHADPVFISTPDGAKKRTWVEPDGYCLLTGVTPAGILKRNLFFELDCGTESGTARSEQKRSWSTKILAYLSYYRAGKFHRHYRGRGMTVLVATTGKEGRLTTLKEATEAAGGRQRFLYTTMERLATGDILTSKVWSAAGTDERRSIVETA